MFLYPCFTLFVCWCTSILKYLYMISKKYVTCTSGEHKPFCQLNQLGDFNINAIANLFVHEKPKTPKVYSGSSRTSRWSFLWKMVMAKKSLTISAKSSILDVWMGSECVSASFFPRTFWVLLGKEVSQERCWEVKEWIFWNVWWDFAEQTIVFTKKCHHVISLDMKIKWLEFLFTSLKS